MIDDSINDITVSDEAGRCHLISSISNQVLLVLKFSSFVLPSSMLLLHQNESQSKQHGIRLRPRHLNE